MGDWAGLQGQRGFQAEGRVSGGWDFVGGRILWL